MTTYNQDDIDLRKTMILRMDAFGLLIEFKKWYMTGKSGGGLSQGDQVIFVGLSRDILTKDVKFLNELIANLTEKNMEAMLKKLTS
jgi:hypothetical protein